MCVRTSKPKNSFWRHWENLSCVCYSSWWIELYIYSTMLPLSSSSPIILTISSINNPVLPYSTSTMSNDGSNFDEKNYSLHKANCKSFANLEVGLLTQPTHIQKPPSSVLNVNTEDSLLHTLLDSSDSDGGRGEVKYYLQLFLKIWHEYCIDFFLYYLWLH